MPQCGGCGEELTQIYGGAWLCEECDSVYTCDNCGIVLSTQHEIITGGSSSCPDCYFGNTNDTEHPFVVVHTGHGAWRCQSESSLVHRTTRRCGCGSYHEVDAPCGRCNPDIPSRGLRRIEDYSFTPNPLVFLKTDNSAVELFVGIELEIERCSKDYGPLDNLTASHRAGLAIIPDWCYTKYDSSVHAGFEIVTQPMSVPWMILHINELVSQFQVLRNLGYRSHDLDTCGMHLHLSKVAFGHVHLYKFMQLFYNNPTLSMLLSQRTTQSFVQWACPYTEKFEMYSRACAKSQGRRSRHDAVNISHRPTIELRIFSGTLNPLVFHKNIETTLAAYRYTTDTTIQDTGSATFVSYVKDNSYLYPCLSMFLFDRGARESCFGCDTPYIQSSEQAEKLLLRLTHTTAEKEGAISVS